MFEVGQRASGQKLPGQRVFRCSVSHIFPGHAPGEFLLEQNPFFRDPVPKLGHGDLVGSAICITRVSVTFFCLAYLRLFFLASSSQWSVLKASFHSLQLVSRCVCFVLAPFS